MKGVAKAIALLGLIFGLGIVVAGFIFQDQLGRRPDALEIRELMHLVAFEISIVSLGVAKVLTCISESMATRNTPSTHHGRVDGSAMA